MQDFSKHIGSAAISITWIIAIYELIVTIVALFFFVLDPTIHKNLTWLQLVLILSTVSFHLIILFLLIIGLYEKASVLILPHLILSGFNASASVVLFMCAIFYWKLPASAIFLAIPSCLLSVAAVWIEWRCFKEIRTQSHLKIGNMSFNGGEQYLPVTVIIAEKKVPK